MVEHKSVQVLMPIVRLTVVPLIFIWNISDRILLSYNTMDLLWGVFKFLYILKEDGSNLEFFFKISFKM